MAVDATRKPVVSRDLTRGLWALWFWCLPIALLVADGAVRQGGSWHLWLGAVAFAIMGTGCAINAQRCGRTHCYVTAPVLLLAALWYLLSAVGVVAPHSNDVSLAVVALVVLAFIAELPFGRYLGARKQVRCG